MNERKIALKILRDIEINNAYINIAINKTFDSYKTLKSEEKGLISELVHGTVEHKITIDYIISQFSSIKIRRLNPDVLNVLRLGIYQILYLDKIPESAAVNESVKLAKTSSGQRSGGYVNGVLRNIIRNKDNIKYPEDKKEFLSVFYSFPMELVELFIDEFGFDFTKDLLEAFNKRQHVTLRCNLLKTTTDNLKNDLQNDNILSTTYKNSDFPTLTYAVSVDKIKNIEKLESYKNGEFYIQDVAAMLVTEVLNPKKDDVVIDMCAAPGGKTTHIAEKMENSGTVYAFDIYEHKIRLIEENAKRLGIKICKAKICDASVLKEEYIEIADRILVDAPCSGIGIIGKKPDIKFQREIADIKVLSEQSLTILDNASKYLKSGGTLVFSTCTIMKEENENVVERFLSSHNDFYLEPIEQISKENDGYVTLYPHIDDTDGFFICKMKKR